MSTLTALRTPTGRRLRLPGGACLARSASYPAQATDPSVVPGPVTLSQDSQYLRVYGVPTVPVVDLATLLGNGSWTREVYFGYDGTDNAGCFSTANGEGYEFRFQGTSFSLEGLMNGNGGSFLVLLDGSAAGAGSCNAPVLTRGTYYQLTGLPAGIHHVEVVKTGGVALYLDTVVLT